MNVQMSDLSKIPEGFGDETQSSQSIFRAALNALSSVWIPRRIH